MIKKVIRTILSQVGKTILALAARVFIGQNPEKKLIFFILLK